MSRMLPVLFWACFLLHTVSCGGQQVQDQAIPANALEQLNQEVSGYIQKDSSVGAELLVIHRGQVLTHQSYGLVDKEDQIEWKNHTLCNIRSMTKPITSVAAQILIDRGKLDLDKPVAAYLESFDNEKSGMITVRQVLTHRSGLPLTNLLAPYQYESLSEQVGKMGATGPQFEPGSRFWYSDIGTDVVGLLVEQVSGERLDQFVQREIFDPLQMTNTMYGIDPDNERLKSAANGYMKGARGWFRFWKSGGKPLYPFAWGSQTVFSTTQDYAKFLQLFLNRGKIGDRQLLSEAAVERMLTPVSRTAMMGSENPTPTGFLDLQSWYGQMMVLYCRLDEDSNGKKKQVVAFGHSGSDGTTAIAWPDRDLMILYFTQSRSGISALQIERAIDRLIIRPDWSQPMEKVPAELRRFVGVYLKPEGGAEEEAELVYSNGNLILDVPSELPFELMPPDEEGFWKFRIAPDKLKLKFELDENGSVTAINLYRGSKVTKAVKKK